MLNGKLAFTDFFVALLAVMFSSFGAGQSGADFSARKRGVEAAGRLFTISDGEVEDDMDAFSTDGDKPNVRISIRTAVNSSTQICFLTHLFVHDLRA